MTAIHTMFDDRVQIYRRPGGKVWHCSTRVGGVRFRATTKEEDISRAKDYVEEWYLGLRGQLRAGAIVKKENSFQKAWDSYLEEVRVLAIRNRSSKYVKYMEHRVKLHV